MRKFFQIIGVLVFISFVVTIFSVGGAISSFMHPEESLNKDAILKLELEGVIMDGKTFLKDLRKYREEPEIKAVLVHINSPGGVVGPSQEIYAELKKTREVYKKPIIVAGSGLVASGAFYSAVAADKIITNPGTLMGSIGVIMEFANLEKLYDWAKIKRYVIKTGAYKDTGSEYREMRADEKALLEGMMNDVLMQFKKAIAEGRKMPIEKVAEYADGRIMTGEMAVQIGFADQIGTLSDAITVAGQMAGLGDDPEVFEPPKERESVLDYLMTGQEESRSDLAGMKVMLNQLKLLGQPLFIMKGSYLE